MPEIANRGMSDSLFNTGFEGGGSPCDGGFETPSLDLLMIDFEWWNV